MHRWALNPLFNGIDDATLRAFEQHLREDSSVYEAFKKIAFRKKEQGFSHYSSKAIIHAIRHEMEERHGKDAFKCNNNWCSLYPCALATRHPEFKCFFEFREAKGFKC